MSDWTFLNANRIRIGPYASTADYGFNGAFSFMLPGEARRIFCIASDGEGWQHVSVSFGKNQATPHWSIMCRVKALFFNPEDVVVQYHPAESQYVNNHPGCLHLWRPTGQALPTPPPEMVGLMELNKPKSAELPSQNDVRRRLKDIAHAVNERVPEGWGFFVFIASPGDGGVANYTSNLQRANAICCMKEFILKAGASEDWMKHIS